MSTLTAHASSTTTAAFPRRDAADIEPDEAWKAGLRKRIEDGFNSMVKDAKDSLENQLRQKSVSAADRERFKSEYTQAMSTIQRLAGEHYQDELNRERWERRWVSVISMEPQRNEVLMQEQVEIMEQIKQSGGQDGGWTASPNSSSTEERRFQRHYETLSSTRPPNSNSSNYYSSIPVSAGPHLGRDYPSQEGFDERTDSRSSLREHGPRLPDTSEGQKDYQMSASMRPEPPHQSSYSRRGKDEFDRRQGAKSDDVYNRQPFSVSPSIRIGVPEHSLSLEESGIGSWREPQIQHLEEQEDHGMSSWHDWSTQEQRPSDSRYGHPMRQRGWLREDPAPIRSPPSSYQSGRHDALGYHSFEGRDGWEYEDDIEEYDSDLGREMEDAERMDMEAYTKEDEENSEEREVRRKFESIKTKAEARIKAEEVKRMEVRRMEVKRMEEEVLLKSSISIPSKPSFYMIPIPEVSASTRSVNRPLGSGSILPFSLKKEQEKQRQQQEDFRKREEEIRRRADERKHQDNAESVWYTATSPISSSPSALLKPLQRSSSANASADRSSTSSTSTWSSASSGWSSASKATSASNSSASSGSRTTTGTPTTKSRAGSTSSNTYPSGASSSASASFKEAEWARRIAEQAQKQQEQFRREQERLEAERQTRSAGKVVSKEEDTKHRADERKCQDSVESTWHTGEQARMHGGKERQRRAPESTSQANKAKIQQEEFRRREEIIKRRNEERRLQAITDADPSAWYPVPSPASSTTSAVPTKLPKSNSTSWSGFSSGWSSTKATSASKAPAFNDNYTITDTPTTKSRANLTSPNTYSTYASPSASTTFKEAEWAHLNAEAQKQQEQFRRDQERLKADKVAMRSILKELLSPAPVKAQSMFSEQLFDVERQASTKILKSREVQEKTMAENGVLPDERLRTERPSDHAEWQGLQQGSIRIEQPNPSQQDHQATCRRASPVPAEQSDENLPNGLHILDNADAPRSSFTSLCNWFITILTDESKYRILLAFRGAIAQKMLDTIQTLLDDPRLGDPQLRKDLLVALLRLSKKSALYPTCYTLKGIQHGDEPVASGHFGEVWKGESEGHQVCLKVVKVFKKSQVKHLLKAFLKEAIVWKHLSHPNLLPFYGIYHLEDRHNRLCLVSPWMANGNIVEFLEQNTDVDRLLLISDILTGISYLHNENIVHGDLKGVNVVITASGRACLADFGLSSVTDADILRWTSVASTAHSTGTTRWQAQELFNPDDEETKPTKESDIYSFSCTCYEVFTGRVPFHEISQDATVISKVMNGKRPSHPSPSIDDSVYHERGMTSTMWRLMEDCWHSDPAIRPTAEKALARLPVISATETEELKDSDVLSPFKFRKANHIPDLSDADIEEIMSLI